MFKNELKRQLETWKNQIKYPEGELSCVTNLLWHKFKKIQTGEKLWRSSTVLQKNLEVLQESPRTCERKG